MTRKRCAWGLCNSDNKYKDRPHMQGITFKPFPQPRTQMERCLQWVRSCNRPHDQLNVKKITPFVYVCSKHFEEGAINPNSACEGDRVTKSRKVPRRRLLELEPPKKVAKVEAENVASTSGASNHPNAWSTPQTEPLDLSVGSKIPKLELDFTPDAGPFEISCEHCGQKNSISDKNIKNISKKRFMDKVQSSNDTCFYYTGIPSLLLLNFIMNWLSPFIYQIKLSHGSKHSKNGKQRKRLRTCLTPREEFILTLVRIRRGTSVEELGFMFGVSKDYVSRIFIAWVKFLDECLSDLLVWSSREQVQKNMPNSFSDYPRTRAVIDCTEYFTQKPLRPHAQRATFSAYKHSNTFKQLIAIMPSGTITFVSKLYAGNISDHSIVKKCGILEKIEPGDDVMADRGFNIQHLLLEKGATLNIPAFTHGKNLSLKAVNRSRKIASVRIHVERAIRRMKTFKILCGIIPLKLRFYLYGITKIVSVLCNLQERLAK